MAFKIKMRKGAKVLSMVKALIVTLISLWVGGQLFTVMANVMLNTTSPFYQGLSIIGWTVASNGTITSVTTSSNTILGVVGLVAIAGIAMRFVQIQF